MPHAPGRRRLRWPLVVKTCERCGRTYAANIPPQLVRELGGLAPECMAWQHVCTVRQTQDGRLATICPETLTVTVGDVRGAVRDAERAAA